jgi:outer membrane protein W
LLDFTHFFNRNIAVELGYTTSRNDVVADLDVDMYQLGVTVQS